MSVKGFKSHPYIPNSVPEVEQEMLREIGLTSLEQLHEEGQLDDEQYKKLHSK